jgi:hypothetical protein
MNPTTLKMVFSALGVASLFALVLMGKMDAIEYTDLVVAAIFGVAGHSAGKNVAGIPISTTLGYSTYEPLTSGATPIPAPATPTEGVTQP